MKEGKLGRRLGQRASDPVCVQGFSTLQKHSGSQQIPSVTGWEAPVGETVPGRLAEQLWSRQLKSWGLGSQIKM